MNHLLDDDEDLQARRDREINLSTGAILGIFFGLVLVCGLFFAFGYNLGQKTKGSTASVGTETAEPGTTNFNTFKPSAGSPAGTTPATPVPTQNPAPIVNVPVASTTSSKPPASDTLEPAEAPVPQPVRSLPAPARASESTAPPPSLGPSIMGSFVVQIAAVSHQEDADLLVGALRSKGYSVAAHNEGGDRLLHIQVGPFSNKRDAEAMRQRLLADGYNAIVK